jgi:hypothetical protein
MGVIKGQNLRLMVEVGGVDKCIAKATTGDITISAQVQSASTKDDEGDWEVNEVVGKSWSASTTCLVSLTDDGSNGELPQDLLGLIINATMFKLVWDTTAGANNRVAQNSALKMWGNCFLQNLKFTSTNRQNVELTADFVGTGPIYNS